MSLARRPLAWALWFAFFFVFVGSIAIFDALEYRFDYYGGPPGDRPAHIYLRSDWGELSGTLSVVADVTFVVGPLVLGLIAYAIVALATTGDLRRTRWRFVVGVPIAAAAMVALWIALFAPLFVFPQRES